jgi:hypothetical protein
MSNLKLGAIALLGAAFLAVGAGCGGSDPSEAQTPANAPTVKNDTSATGGGTETGGGGGETEDPAVAAGKATFEGSGSCQGCHPAGGTASGVGPVLAGAGLTAEAITNQITNPVGAMPANLVSGKDLEDVTAYVLSLQ